MSIFGTYFEKKFPRSTKNLSHDTIFDCGFGKCIPTCFEELTPNDKHVFQHSQFVQPVSLVAPAFSKIRVRQRTFAVPFHLIYGYDHLESFYADTKGEILEPYTTLGDLVQISTRDYWDPSVRIPVLSNGSLLDFMNVTTAEFNVASSLKSLSEPLASKKVSLVKAMSYLKVWNDWYRDDNYQVDLEPIFEIIHSLDTFPYVPASAVVNVAIYQDLEALPLLEYLFTPRMANTGKDYFLGSLPSQQAGDPVRLPLGEEAEVFWKTYNTQYLTAGGEDISAYTVSTSDTKTNRFLANNLPDFAERRLVVDLAGATGLDIVHFRSLDAAQQYAERNARGGQRLVEILRSRFNSKVPDAFLPRSIYVGGTVEDVKIDTIFASSASGDQKLGDYAGRAYSAGSSQFFYYHSFLPCMLVTMQTIVPVPAYFQGIRKDNCRLTVFDKVAPEFAHVGEQPVMSDEFYVNLMYSSGYNKDAIWGYDPRYSDWMVHLDEVHGSFRDSLRTWHTALTLDYVDSNNNPVQNLEVTPQLLTQNYYRDAQRIFTVTPNYEFLSLPFRCCVHFTEYKTTCLPKHPRSY